MGKGRGYAKKVPEGANGRHSSAAVETWPRDARERGDFLHPPRLFPDGMREWREKLVDLAMARRDAFGSLTKTSTRDDARLLIDEGLAVLREVDRILRLAGPTKTVGRLAWDRAAFVLTRVGPFGEAGLNLVRLGSLNPSEVFEALVPGAIRTSLAAMLAGHASSTCNDGRTGCGACEIKKLCADFRGREAERMAASPAPTVADIFCGAGGLSEGFSRAGFRVVAAVDADPVALKTLWLNKPWLKRDQVLATDVRKLGATQLRKAMGVKRLDVLIGAPPCQGFSMAGFRGKLAKTGYRPTVDQRNFLFENLVDYAASLRPRLFLMENVPGMGTARKDERTFLESASKMLERAGFEAAVWELNATIFGVPQDRTRCFLVGASKGEVPLPPQGEYQDIKGAADVDALPMMRLDEALLGLPARRASEGTAVEPWDREQTPLDEKKARRYLAKFRLLGASRLIYNHFARYHNERDLELYALLKPGEDSVHAIERYGRADLMRYRTDVFDDKYSRLRGDRPSKTIVSHLAKDGNGYIHPREVRSITVREAARIQSFGDEYVFCGSPTDQWVQVGNAVPPVMAEAIAKSFKRVLPGGLK